MHIDLKGEWKFGLDREDCGIAEQWFDQPLADTIKLPGSLQERGFGDPPSIDTPWLGTLHDKYWHTRAAYKPYAGPENFKIPYWLQPDRHYVGTAWYNRSIEIPDSWAGRRVVLFLERVHWSSTVWLDGREAGFDDCLSAPHVHDLGILSPGTHHLSIRVDNRVLKTIRADAHSITDSTQSNWNGIVGRMELISKTPVYIVDAKVFTDIDRKTATFKVRVGNQSGRAGTGRLEVGGVEQDVSWTPDGGEAEVTVSLPDDAPLWDEFTPALLDFTLRLSGPDAEDARSFRIGLRKPETRDTRFYMNGKPVFFRGNHEGCQFPLTGYPATDAESWRRIFGTVKSYGLNHVRCHSWCPPEAAFVAADELGLYLQVECSNWGHYGNHKDELMEWLERETEKIIDAFGNHPSFVLFATGNEPSGSWQEPLLDWCRRWKVEDNRRLYATQAGHFFGTKPGPVPHIDFLDAIRIGPYRFRGEKGWYGHDYSAPMDGVNYPIISHETGQWCAFPDFREIEKYTGSFKARNYEIFRDSLEAHGLLDMADAFVQSSGNFQLECYKQDIEAILRTPILGGFQLLDLHDYPGQGTATVGLLNIFWESKGYVTPEQFRKFCNATVLLARMTEYVFRTDQQLQVPVEIAHFGPEPLEGAVPCWRISGEDGEVVRSGMLPSIDIPLGNGIALGVVDCDLGDLPPDRKYLLTVGIEGMEVDNDWEFWLYPAEDPVVPEGDVIVVRSFDQALEALAGGASVLLMPRYHELDWTCPHVGNLPVFWNRLMGPKWERFLGIHCDPEHPALENFATDAHYDWQWADVFYPHCRGINLDRMPVTLKPVVSFIDDWNRNYKLAAAFECRVGAGKLLVCAPDLERDLELRPVARQLRNSLLSYMQGDSFDPQVEVSPAELLSVRFDNQVMIKLGASALASSQSRQREVEHLLDGDPNSYWLSGFSEEGYPHEVTIEFPRPVPFSGLALLNRQDQRAHEGDIREYEVWISSDGQGWERIVTGELESTFDPQSIDFGRTVISRHLKLLALSGYAEDKVAAIANLAALYEGPPLEMELEGLSTYDHVITATEEMDEGSGFFNKFIDRIHASDETLSAPAVHVQNGDNSTWWRGRLHDGQAWIAFTLNQPRPITGISCLPCQEEGGGRIREFAIEISSDGARWSEVLRGCFKPGGSQQTVDLPKPVNGSALRLHILSTFDNLPHVDMAEINILTHD